MSIHKLTAGSGYDYLTRQVAAQDATERGHQGLASYYEAQGEAPGVWVGAGLAGVGMAPGDPVSAEQMQALFGAGRHPLAAQIRAALEGPDLQEKDFEAVTRLGVPFKVYAGDVSDYRREVARRYAALNQARGTRSDGPIELEARARIRTEVAVEFFRAEHGRDPLDAREIAATITRHSRPKTTAVAGYDLTFSPVKSVSALWAIAPPAVAAQIEQAHQDAVGEAITWLEREALYTRRGTNGVRQVDVHGVIATAFTHRDSRAGDPDLHTHVAVANKVQAIEDGAWLAIDGRVLFKATVAASELYNTALEKHLTHRLGVVFAPRPGPDVRQRPVREIVGVDAALNQRWSQRRASIDVRRRELVAVFARTHGRPPTPVEAIQLAQQATLETRQAKKEPRSLGEQRTAWAEQARSVLGGQDQVTAMLRTVLGQPRMARVPIPDDGALTIVGEVKARRATWQRWHLIAEAQRQARAAGISPQDIDQVVESWTEAAVALSVRLVEDRDDVREPEILRRRDGSSQYTVAGSSVYTSREILDAEARIVAAAGRHDGRIVPEHAVDIALLEHAANGVRLNDGQAHLVRSMATSGARVQLAIAPAGSGKTTAMAALATAWTSDGGTVIGLAPSAAAAAVLGEQIGGGGDTLAKLIWGLRTGDMPDWATRIGPDTLVLIDEAGLADTLSLDTALAWILDQGASVRLIGDDQQLAAIGAGGVLRDITATHGALHLSELLRFSDPAEAAASLALREGRPEAIGYYLDSSRLHVGDLATLTEDVFDAWRLDVAAGRDAVMLAPTRDLVAELNRRARTHRLCDRPGLSPAAAPATRSTSDAAVDLAVPVADGNEASAGDIVITRANDRRLRVSTTDWVKNGDRWQVLAVHPDGALQVQHLRHQRVITLPAAYVTAHVDLGYATTVHAAQGVTADASHTLLTGQESRQVAYTAATRGRDANHLYLEVVGDGDPHSVIRPEHIHPATATDILEQILARDDSPRSATTTARDANRAETHLHTATERYLDALHLAAADVLGPAAVTALESDAGDLIPDLADAPAWPTLRARLLLLAAEGHDAHAALRTATTARELVSAADPAAVVDWRLGSHTATTTGPLPWIPGTPHRLTTHPMWGPYLTQRANLIAALRDQVHTRAATAAATGQIPVWAHDGQARPEAGLAADIAVWRAATGVEDTDRRPSGAPQLAHRAATYQQQLEARVRRHRSPALDEWAPALPPPARTDPYAPILAEHLASIARAGLDAAGLLRRVTAEGPLPDDHAAAAIRWRITRHLARTAHTAAPDRVADALAGDSGDTWIQRLPDLLPHSDDVAVLHASTWWPALVRVTDQALARGCALENLYQRPPNDDADVDLCQALLWRISLLTDPPPDAHEDEDPAAADPHGDDPWQSSPEPGPWTEPSHQATDLLLAPGPDDDLTPAYPLEPPDPDEFIPPEFTPDVATWDQVIALDVDGELVPEDSPAAVDLALAAEVTLSLAATARGPIRALPPTDHQLSRALDRAWEQDSSPVPLSRLVEVVAMAAEFYQAQLPGSWAQPYLQERFGDALAAHPDIRAGFAPPGWTTLVTHLRSQGVSDDDMLAAGVATTARTGRLIDRFRDRLVLPIADPHGHTVAFIARRHPQASDSDQAGPKYLNSPDTLLWRKGDHLYTPLPLSDGDVPVLVEGPLDAIAVTIAAHAAGTPHRGVAPLGTSLTQDQATHLAHHGIHLIVATDGDLAGDLARHRAYWLLTQHAMSPTSVAFPPGADPAQTLTDHGPAHLAQLLDAAVPLRHTLLTERLTNLTHDAALTAAATIAAADHPDSWTDSTTRIADHLQVPDATVRVHLAAVVRTWAEDPRPVADRELGDITAVRRRAELRTWAATVDPHLTTHPDWPALATLLTTATNKGLTSDDLTHIATNPALAETHAITELRHRLSTHLANSTSLASKSPAYRGRVTPSFGHRPDNPKRANRRRGSARLDP